MPGQFLFKGVLEFREAMKTETFYGGLRKRGVNGASYYRGEKEISPNAIAVKTSINLPEFYLTVWLRVKTIAQPASGRKKSPHPGEDTGFSRLCVSDDQGMMGIAAALDA
ncbi:MAG: hypothetical protein ACYTG7_09110 [Planctomycetota bacterium]